jgi:hypothetical protein
MLPIGNTPGSTWNESTYIAHQAWSCHYPLRGIMKRTRHGKAAPAAHHEAEVTPSKSPRAGGESNVMRVEAVAMEPPAPLTKHEKYQLDHCEKILQTGLRTFFDVGNALTTIRDGRLHRTTHSTFESYCRDHWGIGRSYASRVIGAAERIKLLPPGETIPKPCNEFQVRPFLKLKPEAFLKAWERTVRRAKGGKVTPSLVRDVVAEITPKSTVATKGSKRSRSERKVPVGQILVLLHDAKGRLKRGETDDALAVLEQIEAALCSPRSWPPGS